MKGHALTSATSDLAAWSYGLAGLVFSAFTFRLWVLGHVRPATRHASTALWAALGFSALWAFSSFAALFVDDLAFVGAATVADIARYASWYLCLLGMLGGESGDKIVSASACRRPLFVIGACLVVVALVTQWPASIDLGWDSNARAVLLSAMSLPVFAMVLVEQLYRNLPEDSRWNAKPLCLGLTATFVFDLYIDSQALMIGHADPTSFGVRGFIHVLMVPLIWLSVTRRRDWIARVRLSRKAAFHSATLLIAGIYLLVVSTIGYYVRFFGGDWGQALQLTLVAAALIAFTVLAFSGSARARLKVLLGKHFFQYRYDYREEWLRFTQTLSSQESPQEMGQQVVRGLADMLESPAGQLWTRQIGAAAFTNTAHWNMPAQADAEEARSPFCQFLSRSGWVIDLQQHAQAPQRYDHLVLPAWISITPRAWLVVPLRVGEELTGFVVLASPRTAMDINWEVNDLLKTAGRQAASFLAQMQATEALLEVRKFDAFNRMSAFVVHDLKNIVTQLSLMMKNAKRLQDNREFQQDMLMTVENSLDRMRQLMLQLREGATPAGTAFGVDLAEVVGRLASLTAYKGRSLDIDAVERITARGDGKRLERVIGHLIQNALDATEKGGEVSVRLDRGGGRARVEVADTGHGMSRDFVANRLFKPFQTTKHAGMGIGAYESFQYVQELGGSIEVDSEPGRGTRVTVLLPLFDSQNESDLYVFEAT